MHRHKDAEQTAYYRRQASACATAALATAIAEVREAKHCRSTSRRRVTPAMFYGSRWQKSAFVLVTGYESFQLPTIPDAFEGYFWR